MVWCVLCVVCRQAEVGLKQDQGRGRQAFQASGAISLRRPDADSSGTPKAKSSRLASVHGRTGRRIWIMLAELVKRFPQHVLHIFQREPRTNLEGNTNLLTIQLKIPERYFIRYVLKAVSGWRGDHTRQLKPETSQTTQQPISCTPDTQGTSHLSASMVPRSRNTKFHCSPGLTFHPTFFFGCRSSVCQSHGFQVRDSASGRRSDGPIIRSLQGHQKGKPGLRAKCKHMEHWKVGAEDRPVENLALNKD